MDEKQCQWITVALALIGVSIGVGFVVIDLLTSAGAIGWALAIGWILSSIALAFTATRAEKAGNQLIKDVPRRTQFQIGIFLVIAVVVSTVSIAIIADIRRLDNAGFVVISLIGSAIAAVTIISLMVWWIRRLYSDSA